jgi:hypothetical protein
MNDFKLAGKRAGISPTIPSGIEIIISIIQNAADGL